MVWDGGGGKGSEAHELELCHPEGLMLNKSMQFQDTQNKFDQFNLRRQSGPYLFGSTGVVHVSVVCERMGHLAFL